MMFFCRPIPAARTSQTDYEMRSISCHKQHVNPLLFCHCFGAYPSTMFFAPRAERATDTSDTGEVSSVCTPFASS